LEPDTTDAQFEVCCNYCFPLLILFFMLKNQMSMWFCIDRELLGLEAVDLMMGETGPRVLSCASLAPGVLAVVS